MCSPRGRRLGLKDRPALAGLRTGTSRHEIVALDALDLRGGGGDVDLFRQRQQGGDRRGIDAVGTARRAGRVAIISNVLHIGEQ